MSNQETSDQKPQEGEQRPQKEPNGKPRAAQGKPPEKKKSKKGIFILLFVVIIGGIAGYFYYLHTRDFVGTDNAFIDGHIVQISPRISAIVKTVHFDDNQDVKKGDLLIELDPHDFEVSLEKAQAQLALAQGQLEQRKAELAQSEAQQAQTNAQLAQQKWQVELAGINFRRNQSLYQKDMHAVAGQDVDTTKANLEVAKASFDAYEASVKAAAAAVGAAKAHVTAEEANVANGRAAVHDAQLQLSYTTISAVADGRIARKQVEPGNYVQPSQVMTSLVLNDLWVTANYKETQLTNMRVGQAVEIKVDAFPHRTLKAHVASFQPGTGARFSLLPAENATGNYVKVVQRVPVKIVFDENADTLRLLGVGMSVDPTVDVRSVRSGSGH